MARYRSKTGQKPRVRRNYPGKRGSVVLSELTHGAYNRTGMQGTSGKVSWTLGTEVEVADVASTFKGDNTNKITKVFPWIRINWLAYCDSSTVVGAPFEVFVLKSKQSDSLEDMSDPDVCERKFRAGEVFHHSVHMVKYGYTAYPQKIEFKSVRLLPDEELRMLYLPWYTQTTSVWFLDFPEWREPQYG